MLESTKQAALEMRAILDKAGIVQQDAALRQANDLPEEQRPRSDDEEQ